MRTIQRTMAGLVLGFMVVLAGCENPTAPEPLPCESADTTGNESWDKWLDRLCKPLDPTP